MILVKPKPNININYNHTILEIEDAIPHEICDICLNDGIQNSMQRGKSKNEHLWKAQFDSTLILDMNHIIYEFFNIFWENYVKKTNVLIDFIEPYEVKKYKLGDFFEPHRDNYFVLDSKLDRKLNLIVQLSNDSDYDGGNLVLGTKTVSRNKGCLVIFPAMYIHQVETITRGERVSLIGHAWGPNWI